MKEKFEDWLKRIIEAHHCFLDLRFGPEGITLCGMGQRDEIQIYQGLEKLAFYLDIPVTYNPNWDIEVGEMYFYYNGVKFFELWKKFERG